MRVCMVSHHSCIRVFKQGFALAQLDDVTVGHIAFLTTFGFNIFDTMTVFSDREMLRRSVGKAAEKADLFHVHNEPDWLVGNVRAMTDKPIVYDIHDLESLRWQRGPDQDQLDSFGMSDAWVHVSEPCRIEAEKLHGNSKPNAMLPSFVNDIFYGPTPAGDVSWDSIVYEGGLSSESTYKAHTGEEISNFRNYLPVVEAFTKQGFNVQLYATGQINDNAYEELGAVVGTSLAYPVMLAAIRPYAFGLVGASKKFPLMQAALPNKLFEYISQGVVPVCYNADAAADFCEKHGIGIRLDGLDDLKEQLKDGPACRERLLEKRHDWAMEKHIGKIIELYEAIL
jgi:hypothetical protein